MAPMRKSRSVNKRFPDSNEASPVKDGDSAGKSSKRKRKVSDMLGPQWSKEDLQRFYEAYRKYGKDWKKVAAAVHNRSVEMVEALYTMNRAYLSLPEGTASVVGLIAMMTDHYSVLEGSDSEQESNDGVGLSRKPQKRPRGKSQPTPQASDKHISDVSRSQSVASTYGCLSFLKKRRLDSNQPRAVGKRTPRIPVRYTYDNMERYISPRLGLKSKLETADDDVAHEVALALAEASHRGGSPQASQTPNRRRDTAATSPAGLGDQMCSESEMTSAKNIGNEMDDDDVCDDSLGSTEGDCGFPGGKRHFAGKKGGGTLVHQKAKKSYGKKLEVEDVGQHDVDDIKEACSGTEEGQRFSGFGRKLRTEFQDKALVRPPGQASKKRSKKVLFGEDEGVALDALQALADLSFMMPGSAAEAESTEPPKEEKERSISQFRAQESGPSKAKAKASPSKKKVDNSALNTQVSESTMLKSGKLFVPESSPVGEIKDSGTRGRKQKSFVSKSASEVKTNADLSSSKKEEVRDNGMKLVTMSTRSSHIASEQHGDLVKNSEHSSSSVDIRREGDDSVFSSIQASPTININSPTKFRSRRKLNKPQIQRSSRDLKNMETYVHEQSKSSGWSSHDKVVDLKEKLSNCLRNTRVRRRCIYEWFYSAIDYPWFAKSEFVEYLYHVGLGHVPRLTRVEWGVIRSSLGRPRRFSEQFLKEEKEKLNYYRESVRNHYSELRMGKREGLPADLARPLSVGQHVIAIHPRSREASNGSILTVDHKRCRVQFDQPELGVEFVKDVDCMPLNPLENMPTSLKRHNLAVDKFYEALKQFKVSERLENRMKEEFIKFTPGQKVENPGGACYAPPAFLSDNLSKVAKEAFVSPNSHEKAGHNEVVSPLHAVVSQQSTLSQMQAREADIRALADLTRALDKKNALVMELKRMNDDVSEDSSLKNVDCFKKQYAAVLVQLNEVLDQVSSALLCLRQRNTYQGNCPLLWQKPTESLEDRGNIACYFSSVPGYSQEAGSHVCEIVETSTAKAQKMVDAVLQVVSSIKKGANVCHRIDDVVDDGSHRLSADKSTAPLQTTQPNGSLACHNQLTSCDSNLKDSDQAPDSILKVASVEGESEVPSELIRNCVATLLMIQKCTERQFPPAEVAQILDFAVANLQPRCSQNLPVYAEIQKCMGIIRSQILALIPT